jgi:hypothetical protein
MYLLIATIVPSKLVYSKILMSMDMHFLRLKFNNNKKLKITKCGWESWVTLQSVFLGSDHHNLGHVKYHLLGSTQLTIMDFLKVIKRKTCEF